MNQLECTHKDSLNFPSEEKLKNPLLNVTNFQTKRLT